MKLRDEVMAAYGLVVPDDQIDYEDDDQFVTKSGMGWMRHTEVWWRNIPQEDLPKVTEDTIEEAVDKLNGKS